MLKKQQIKVCKYCSSHHISIKIHPDTFRLYCLECGELGPVANSEKEVAPEKDTPKDVPDTKANDQSLLLLWLYLFLMSSLILTSTFRRKETH